MRMDLHVHTTKYSPCSSILPREVIDTALEMGLQGAVITDHNTIWPKEEREELRKYAVSRGFLILFGRELDTEKGHVLVFGFDQALPRSISFRELKTTVQEAGGAIVLAHPFRWGHQSGRNTEEHKVLFELFDGIEALNGKCGACENRRARHIAESLGLPVTGGSDAHSIHMLGRCYTEFDDQIMDEKDLVQAIRSGRLRPGPAGEEEPDAEAELEETMLDVSRCRALLFNLHGTLLNLEMREDRDVFERMAMWLSLLGMKAGGTPLLMDFYSRSNELYQRTKAKTSCPEVDIAEVFRTLIRDLHGEDLAGERLELLCLGFRAMSVRKVTAKPWAVKTLAMLKEMGFLLGVVTNSQKLFAVAEMKMTGILDYFDTVVCSSEVGVQKPHPDIFNRALENLGIQASQAVMIGHEPVCDIAGARRLAIPAILLKGPAPSGRFQIEPDMVIYDFEMDGFAKLFEKDNVEQI